jgi:uncharacterized protein
MIINPSEQLLQFTKHRPFPLPDKPWLIYQQWNDVLFLHSPVKPDVVKRMLPAGLELDTISGYAWLSVVVFTITNTRTHLLPFIPMLPTFNEFNLRTYVRCNNIPGIYFIHIKASSQSAVLMNRVMTKLRYQHANIRKTPPCHYFMTAEKGSNMLDIDFNPGRFFNAVPALDRWLTERYCCYQEDGARIYRYNIHHPAWPLYEVQTNYHMLRYNLPNLLLTDQSVHLLHYSPVQSALIWQKDRVV